MGRGDLPWGVDHLQQNSKILCTVVENNPRAPFWHLCVEKSRLGKHVSEFGGGERDYRGVDPEDYVLAHNLNISVL